MNKILIALSITCLLACAENTKKLPQGILSSDQMIGVMVDLQLIEGLIAVRDTELEEVNTYYQSIFKKHQIDKETLDKSIQYYSKHPDILEIVYQEVITELSKKQARVNNEVPPSN